MDQESPFQATLKSPYINNQPAYIFKFTIRTPNEIARDKYAKGEDLNGMVKALQNEDLDSYLKYEVASTNAYNDSSHQLKLTDFSKYNLNGHQVAILKGKSNIEFLTSGLYGSVTFFDFTDQLSKKLSGNGSFFELIKGTIYGEIVNTIEIK